MGHRHVASPDDDIAAPADLTRARLESGDARTRGQPAVKPRWPLQVQQGWSLGTGVRSGCSRASAGSKDFRAAPAAARSTEAYMRHPHHGHMVQRLEHHRAAEQCVGEWIDPGRIHALDVPAGTP